MGLPRDLVMCVRFARFALDYKIDPADLALMVSLARKAMAAGVRECNGGRSADKQQKRFEEAAGALGFTVVWDELRPTITKDGRRVDFAF